VGLAAEVNKTVKLSNYHGKIFLQLNRLGKNQSKQQAFSARWNEAKNFDMLYS